MQSPGQQGVPQQPEPQQVEPPAAAQENPSLINEIGKLFEKSKSILPPLKSPGETIDDLNTRARDAGESLSNMARPSSMVTGRAACLVAANGAPDCKAGCQLAPARARAAWKARASTPMRPRNASPKSVHSAGVEPGDCKTENYVTRALCQ